MPWADGHRDVLSGCAIEDAGRTAVVHFARPVPAPRDWLGIAILPEHAFDGPVVPEDHPFATEAFGSLGARARLTPTGARVDHDDASEPPRLHHFVIRSDLDHDAVVRGEAHGIIRATQEQVRAAASDDRRIRTFDTRGVVWLAVSRQGALGDRGLRRMLDLAIDRPILREAIWETDPEDPNPPVELLMAPVRQYSELYARHVKLRTHQAPTSGAIPPLRLGVGEAQEREVPGLADALVAHLADQGVSVDLVRLPGDPLAPGADPAALASLDLLVVYQPTHRPERLAPVFAADGRLNPFGVHADASDALLERFRMASDARDRREAAHELMVLAADDVTAIWLMSVDWKSVWRQEVQTRGITPGVYWSGFGSWHVGGHRDARRR